VALKLYLQAARCGDSAPRRTPLLIKIWRHHAPRRRSKLPWTGAHALGFVFWPTALVHRSLSRAGDRVALPAFVTTVGVFVNQHAEYVNGVAAAWWGLRRFSCTATSARRTAQR